MIIDKVRKLIGFFKKDPVNSINRYLDSAASFCRNQVNYAQIVALSVTFISAISIIIPYKSFDEQDRLLNDISTEVKKATRGSFKKPIQKTAVLVDSHQNLSSKKVKTNESKQSFAPSLSKRVERLPVSFIMSYSLSQRQAGVKFCLSLKLYQKYGQIPLYKDQIDRIASYGFYADSYSLIKPLLPGLNKQAIKFRLYSHALNWMKGMKNYLFVATTNDMVRNASTSEQETTGSDTLNDSDGSGLITQNVTAQSRPGLVRTSSHYPLSSVTERRQARDPRDRRLEWQERRHAEDAEKYSKNVAKHLLESIYFKVDLLNTFVMRIEQ